VVFCRDDIISALILCQSFIIHLLNHLDSPPEPLVSTLTMEWTPNLSRPVNPSNTWNGEYWDDISEKVFQGV
jgi:hypothetical protein